MKEVENIFYMTGVILLLFVFMMIFSLVFDDYNYKEFCASLIIATIGFASILIGAYCEGQRIRKGK